MDFGVTGFPSFDSFDWVQTFCGFCNYAVNFLKLFVKLCNFAYVIFMQKLSTSCFYYFLFNCIIVRTAINWKCAQFWRIWLKIKDGFLPFNQFSETHVIVNMFLFLKKQAFCISKTLMVILLWFYTIYLLSLFYKIGYQAHLWISLGSIQRLATRPSQEQLYAQTGFKNHDWDLAREPL